MEGESDYQMKILRADGDAEFISNKLQFFCEKRGITIRYVGLYMHEENGLAKQGWRTIVTMKNLMLIDSGVPNAFRAEIIETANYLYNKLPT